MHGRTIVGGLIVAAAFAIAPGAALADETDKTVDQINGAVAAEGTAPVTRNSDVSIPSTGSGLVTIGGDSQPGEVAIELPEVTVDLPARGVADQAGRTTVFDANGRAADIAVQPTANGVRALVSIESAKAPERYPFALGGDVVRLELQADGSVYGYDTEDVLVTRIAPAWARDANGRDVPTYYELNGTTIVQIVSHRGGDWAYGITADPSLEFHWHWPHKARAWFNRKETERLYRNLYGPALAGSAANLACSLIPNPAIKIACSAVVLAVVGDFTVNVTQAHNRRQCLTVDVYWLPRPWINWNDKGGGRCN